jgi:hypothetical protein
LVRSALIAWLISSCTFPPFNFSRKDTQIWLGKKRTGSDLCRFVSRVCAAQYRPLDQVLQPLKRISYFFFKHCRNPHELLTSYTVMLSKLQSVEFMEALGEKWFVDSIVAGQCNEVFMSILPPRLACSILEQSALKMSPYFKQLPVIIVKHNCTINSRIFCRNQAY